MFIAPTRFAAGVPFKVHKSLSYGLPVVSSRLVAEQLKHDGKAAGGLSAATVKDDGKEFADACIRLLHDDNFWLETQEAALAHMESCCAPSALDATVQELIRELSESSLENANSPADLLADNGQRRAVELQ